MVAAGVAGPAAAGVEHSVHAAPFAACTLDGSGKKPTGTEHTSCISVVATLSRPPVVGEQATLTFTVTAAVAVSKVEIRVELPPRLRWVTRPAGMVASSRVSRAAHNEGTIGVASTTRSMAAGERLRFSGVVRAVAAGTAEIDIWATGNLPGHAGAGADAVFLTIAEAGGQSRFGISAKPDGPAVRATGAPKATPLKRNPAKPAGKAGPRPATQVEPPAVVQSPFGTACVSGTWHYTDNNGALQVAISWRVEVWDQDADGDDLLASGLTGFSGEYTLCFNNGDDDGSGQDVYVKFLSDNGNWRVTTAGDGIYNYSSGVVADVADGSTTGFGALIPGVPDQMRAAAAFAATQVVWNNTPGTCWDMNSTCRAVVIRWEPASTDGTFYSTGTNDVHLAAADPDAPITVAHEVSHSIMDDVFDDAFPAAPSCIPHTIPAASSAGCAWTEGFAEWLPAMVFNDPNFRWPDGSSLNLENPTFGSPGWNDGDTVEGRVAGAMIDLSDPSNEGTDRVGEGIANLWTTFQNHNSATFSAFWTDRGNDGFDVSNNALGSLFQSTIDYGFVR